MVFLRFFQFEDYLVHAVIGGGLRKNCLKDPRVFFPDHVSSMEAQID